MIGGGNSGVEAAIDLAGLVSAVTLLEFGTELRADAVLQRKLRSLKNVTIITQAQTTEVTGDGKKVNGLSYKDLSSGEAKHIELEGVFVQIGLVPNTEWLKGTVELSRHGEIVVDAQGRNVGAGRVRGRRCHHRAVQADRDRGRRRGQSVAQRIRLSDPEFGVGKRKLVRKKRWPEIV